MVPNIKGGTQAKGICKQDPVANIWAQKVSNGEWRRLHNGDFIICTIHLVQPG